MEKNEKDVRTAKLPTEIGLRDSKSAEEIIKNLECVD